MRLAIMDYDGTLFTKETIPFLLGISRSSGISFMDWGITVTRVMMSLVRYKSGLDKKFDKEAFHIHVANQFLGIFRGMNRKEIEEFFIKASIEAEASFHPRLLEELQVLKEKGYTTVLLSGGFLPYISLVGERLGFSHVIGTELTYKEKGFQVNQEIRYITGKNKSASLKELFPQGVDWANSIAFGDSYFDAEVLALTGNPVAVNPDPGLFAIANERGWRVIPAWEGSSSVDDAGV